MKKKDNKYKTVKKRIENNKKKFLELYRESKGIVTLASQKLGIAPSTYYDWYNKDPEFKKQIDAVEQEQVGFVKDLLLRAVAERDLTAIIFYLKNKSPEFQKADKFQHSFENENVNKILDIIGESLDGKRKKDNKSEKVVDAIQDRNRK